MSRIVIKNLSMGYGATKILDSLNLDIEQGEFIVLLGPSGCGKSTLLHCIAGLNDIDEGQVFINDKNVTWLEPKDRGIGMVFQSYALYPQMTVERNLSFGLRVSGMAKKEVEQRVRWAADTLQISTLLQRKPGSLSGGQRQRVAIGRALVRDADVFLFDEPLSNLDAKLRAELRVEIKRLHKKLKNTMVYVTHDQIEALTLADRIAVMRSGEIQQFDTPEQIYSNPQNRFVAEFMGAPGINFVKGALQSTQDQWHFVSGGISLPLANYPFKQSPNATGPVELAIRPEHLVVGESAKQLAITLDAQVDLVEPMGSDAVLWTRVGDISLAVRVPGNAPVTLAGTISLGLDPAHLMFFSEHGSRL